MALTLDRDGTAPLAALAGQPSSAEQDSSVARSSRRTGLSPMVVGFGVMAAAIVAVLGLSMAMMLFMTDISVLAAFGFGLYCAFWLGIGFGTIFGSAAVFGRSH